MPSATNGIAGVGVALWAAGAVVLYSAVKNATVSDTLRSLIKGKAVTGSSTGSLAASEASVVGQFQDVGAGAAGSSLVSAARRYLGVPYGWAQASSKATDCSGLVNMAARDAGFPIPGSPSGAFSGHGPDVAAWYTWSGLITIPAAQASSGDLVIWGPNAHIGIVVSQGRMIDAPTFGEVVQEQSIWNTPAPIYRRYAAQVAPGPHIPVGG